MRRCVAQGAGQVHGEEAARGVGLVALGAEAALVGGGGRSSPEVKGGDGGEGDPDLVGSWRGAPAAVNEGGGRARHCGVGGGGGGGAAAR